MENPRQIRSYVLRQGRMSDAQKRSYDNLFPLFGIKAEEAGVLDSRTFFGNGNPLTVEIGFGMGTATAAIARENPEINYLGIEVHKPGIGRLLWSIEKTALRNIRIVEGDAADVIAKNIRENTVSAFHVFFPDPWPKKRHHKRRLITRPFTDTLAAKLVPGGYIYFATDWEEYADWALEELSATPGFVNKYGGETGGFAEPRMWRPTTEFERKGISKNHNVRELYFIKNGV